MRTEDQVKRKLNEMKQLLKANEDYCKLLGEQEPINDKEIARIEERLGAMRGNINILEWVINEPRGGYHS